MSCIHYTRAIALTVLLVVGAAITPCAAADPVSDAMALLDEGAKAMKEGHLTAACDKIQAAYDIFPTWWVTNLELAQCLHVKGAPPAEILSLLEATLTYRPSTFLALHLKGVVLEEQADLDGAIEAYSAAIALDPLQRQSRLSLARVYLAKGATDAVLETLKPLLEGWNDSPLPLILAMKASAAADAYDKAITTGIQALLLSTYPLRVAASLRALGIESSDDDLVGLVEAVWEAKGLPKGIVQALEKKLPPKN